MADTRFAYFINDNPDALIADMNAWVTSTVPKPHVTGHSVAASSPLVPGADPVLYVVVSYIPVAAVDPSSVTTDTVT